MSTASTVELLGSIGVVAVLRGSAQEVGDIVDDLDTGGLHAIEITFSVPGAGEIIRRLSDRPNLIVGAGTVTSPERAEEAIAAGARFLVSPVSTRWLVDIANEAGVLAVPGCATPTEIWTAVERGALAVTVFPAARLGGPTYLRDLAAPLPGLRLMPSGGIRIADVPEYRAAGAWAVGLGGEFAKAPSGRERSLLAASAVRLARSPRP